jgi:hypothetical protein
MGYFRTVSKTKAKESMQNSLLGPFHQFGGDATSAGQNILGFFIPQLWVPLGKKSKNSRGGHSTSVPFSQNMALRNPEIATLSSFGKKY